MQQKIKKIKMIMALGSRHTTNSTQQAEKTEGGIMQDARPDGDMRGVPLHQFWGNQVERR
jgi:hypothetical protein